MNLNIQMYVENIAENYQQPQNCDVDHLHVDGGPEVEERGGGGGVSAGGREVERRVARDVHLVHLQPLPRHLLAQPPGDPVLQRGEHRKYTSLQN